MGKAGRKKEKPQNKIADIRSSSVAPRPWVSAYGWIIPLALALLVNAGVLLNGFAWEDNPIGAALSDQRPQIDSPAISSDSYFRPFINWSNHFDHWLWGPGPFGPHFTVYLAHALTTLLVYGSVKLLTQFYQKQSSIALITASLFAVHPIHAEAVAWINGRSDVFMALFMMLAFYAYLLYRRGTSVWITLPLFISGSILGLLSKETAIPFMLFFPALYFLLPRLKTTPSGRMRNSFLWIGMLVLAGFIVFRFSHMELPSQSPEGSGSLPIILTTLLSAWGYDLKMLLIPYPLNLFPSAPNAGQAQGLLHLIIGISGALGLFWIIVRCHRTLWAMGAAWLVSGLVAPLMVPLVKVAVTPVAERYTYLASGGFLLMVGVGVMEGWNRGQERLNGPRHAGWTTGVAGFLVVLFSVLTIDRNTAWQNALVLWEDTVRKSPLAALPHNNLGVLYSDQKRWDDAGREFQTAVQLNPDYLKAYYNLGVAYEQNHRREDAVRAFQKTLTLQPNFVQARFNLGNDYAAQGQLQAAIQEYQTFLTHHPNHAMAHMNLGNVYVSQRRYDQAIQEYQIALRLQPNLTQAYYNLGTAYAEQGRLDDAIRAHTSALKIQPDFAEAYYSLGNLYTTEKRLDDAVKAYRTALTLKPDYAEAHNDLGIAYLQQARYEEASQQFKATLNLLPNHSGAHNNLGVIHARNGRFDEAAIEFGTALELNPTNVQVRTSLGMALLRQGKRLEAKKEFEKALQIQPDFLPARQALNSMHR
jgi:tetratricopeptide (TPR) repeat protein